MYKPNVSQTGLKVLCIDNGGIRGLSALLLINEVMKTVQKLEGLETTPEPHHYFDVIAGTGTGAIHACMIGCLRMSIQSALESYAKLAKDVFSDKKQLGIRSFKMTKLKESLREIIQDATGNPDKPITERETIGHQCKTLVFAVSQTSPGTNKLFTFRSYLATAEAELDCTIWEALCATMAYPGIFGSYLMNGTGLLGKQLFVDGGTSCNNPVFKMLAEVKSWYPSRHPPLTILSIGTGHPRTIQISDQSRLPRLLPVSTVEAMQSISTESEKLAEDMNANFSATDGVYVRLSVDQGMQNMEAGSWEELSEVTMQTHKYMMSEEIVQRIGKIAQAIRSKGSGISRTIDDAASVETISEEVYPGFTSPKLESSAPWPYAPGGSGGPEDNSDKAGKRPSGHDRDPPSRRQTSLKVGPASKKAKEKQGLNILCIDGGGVRGLSSLLLIQEAMNRIQGLEDYDGHGNPAKPSDWFDIIAGTGTGGLIACMLGKLQMPIEEAIKEYKKLTEEVFSRKKMIGENAYRGDSLEKALQSMIERTTGNKDKKMMEDVSYTNDTKTIIFAMLGHNMNACRPVMFRSYFVSAGRTPDCSIWKAIYASMAHPEFFKSITITEDSVNYSFIGGELGNSNPLAYVLSEVRDLHPDHYVSCIMSIGTGHPRTIQILNSDRHQAAIAIRNMAYDSERVAEEMAKRFQDVTDVYFRFNVDQGLQDIEADSWEKLSNVAEHTKAYLNTFEINQAMNKAITAVFSRSAALAVTYIDGRAQRPSKSAILKNCPIPTAYYTGRDKETRNVENCIIDSTDQQRRCVIYGLGGAGKSQLAFKVIRQNRCHWKHIIYIEANSRETIESTLQCFAGINNLGPPYEYENTLLWLRGTPDSWLLVFDGADDPDIDIRSYFPSCDSGSIIITTRIRDRVVLAEPRESVCHVSKMDPKDASLLLLRVANMQTPDESPTVKEKEAADALVNDFDYLALAIVHAGAYIAHSTGMNISTYHRMFLDKRKATLEGYESLPKSFKFDNYGKTVYTTWNMCYELLGRCRRPAAQKLLWLITFLHHKSITKAIFQRAAKNIRFYKPLHPTELEKKAHRFLYEHLPQIVGAEEVDSEDNWTGSSFIATARELAALSMIEYNKGHDAYAIHVLVQDWARTVIPDEVDLSESLERTASLLAISIGSHSEEDTSSYEYRLGLGAHLKRILSESESLRKKQLCDWKININHAISFADVFKSMELWSEEQSLREKVKDIMDKLDPNDPMSLRSTDNLALNYRNQGQLDMAEGLYKESFERRLILYGGACGEEHEDICMSKKYLASLYQSQGRFDEALPLWEAVVNSYMILKGGNDPETLTCTASLADVYLGLGQLENAKNRRQQTLSMLGDDDPGRPMCMRQLAVILERLGEWENAEGLLRQSKEALDIRWGIRHQEAISGQKCLAEFMNRKPSALLINSPSPSVSESVEPTNIPPPIQDRSRKILKRALLFISFLFLSRLAFLFLTYFGWPSWLQIRQL